MRLAFTYARIVTNYFDPDVATLADRRNSPRTVGVRQFL